MSVDDKKLRRRASDQVRLSPRMVQVIQMLADGRTAPQIHEILGISKVRIRRLIDGAKARLGVRRRG